MLPEKQLPKQGRCLAPLGVERCLWHWGDSDAVKQGLGLLPTCLGKVSARQAWKERVGPDWASPVWVPAQTSHPPNQGQRQWSVTGVRTTFPSLSYCNSGCPLWQQLTPVTLTRNIPLLKFLLGVKGTVLRAVTLPGQMERGVVFFFTSPKGFSSFLVHKSCIAGQS